MKKFPKFYRGRLACFAPCVMLLALCSLLPRAQAGGSWIVDGQAVQALEVQTTNDDPVALHTDGSRNMAAPIKFDASVSSPTNGLLQAYYAIDGQYVELFMLDEDEEALWLSDSANVALRVGDLYITPSTILHISAGTKIAFEDQVLEGGWMIDSVLNHNYAVMNRSYADARYPLRSEGVTITHTIQAGDVLQIQDGIITAVNP